MKLEHDFTVDASPAQAWSVLLDVERVAPCLPGAALDGGDGTEFSGSMTVRLGPVTSRYRGTVRIEETDEAARRAVLRARGSDPGGAGSAAATITTRLEPAGDATRVLVETDLAISGPAARFGRGVMQDVSAKLMHQFADCLAGELGAGGATLGRTGGPASGRVLAGIAYEDTEVGPLPIGPAGEAVEAAVRVRTAPPGEGRSADVLDLGAASRGAIAKRVLPALAAAGLAVAAFAVWRRSRR
jgi:uncharacterized protein